MSAQRRPATKRDATAAATPRRGAATAARPAQPATGQPDRSGADRAKSGAAAHQERSRRGFGERIERVRSVYRETAAEIKRINWPDQETTRNLTIVVIGISVVLGILLGGIDFLLLRLFELF